MNIYSGNISLNMNKRGVYDLDVTKGCTSGISHNKKGCYSECYAARYAKLYGYDFSKTIKRTFKSVKHVDKIRNEIHYINMPFIRIGVMGDPSENWGHLLKILNLVSGIKPIVIITKHWYSLTLSQLNKLSKHNVCVNTSISALDEPCFIKHRLNQYDILKNYCKSVLRIVSCDFNMSNLKGLYLNDIQNELFNNKLTIDNVFRVSKNNKLIKMNIINYHKKIFLNNEAYFSQINKNTYTGFCKSCPDMCGINTI